MNECTFCGRLLADPEVSKTNGGTAKCIFKLAVDRTLSKEMRERAKKDPSITTVDWPRFICFGHSAEVAGKYLFKGRQVIVKSHYQSGSYIDKATGEKKYTNDFIVYFMEFVGSKPNDAPDKIGTDDEDDISYSVSEPDPEPSNTIDDDMDW